MLKKSALLILFSTFATSLAHAFPQGDMDVVIFSAREKIEEPLYSFIQPQVEVAATQQAQIWGDTILEGDYVADGKTQVDEVIAVYKNNILQGYRLTYSEKAWMITECDFDHENLDSLNSCTPGRIVESSYSSPDFKDLEQDENSYAEFFND